MSETNSFNPPDQGADEARPRDADAMLPPDAAAHALFERIGAGGMGEVYRCGDDALRRDLAIKVIKARLRGNDVAEQRFLREARLTGSLQHPGVVPVHHLGRLADGRLCYTMKLVRGRTLADLLRDEPDGPERLPRLLAVVEKVCQTVAYAHSKGVLHRDLKPSNVMVGEFGEVQVMDWGLAKELSRPEPAPPGEAVEDVETVAYLSRAGAVLGTPAYMPPEQAAGDWDSMDERADVFALGAVLYQVLTGRAPYQGANREEVLRRARQGDLAAAFARLEGCRAEAALTMLCRECLAPERESRPRNAGAVAERLAAYQAEVQERLRQSEVARVAAQVKVREERKRRRLWVALALAAVLLVLGGAAAWWQGQRRQAEADGAVAVAMGEARLLGERARMEPLKSADYDKAVAWARKAAEMARSGGASETVQRQAEELLAGLQVEAETAEKDRRLLVRLLEVRGPREGPKYSEDGKGGTMALPEPTAEEQFASAFRDWGLDVDAVPTAEAAARLKKRPTAVVTEVIAALDDWTSQRRVDRKPGAEWRPVAELAEALDDDPGSLRRELRSILAQDRLRLERALDVLSVLLRPVPVPVEVPLGTDRLRLRHLAEQTDPAAEPMLGVRILTRALHLAGDNGLAEQLLRAAVRAHPQEVVLYHALAQLLADQKPPRWAEVVECCKLARAVRPQLGLQLAEALLFGGRKIESLALREQMVKDAPGNPYYRFLHGMALDDNGDREGAIARYREAIALDPQDADYHYSLGIALYDKGDQEGAISSYRQAIALKPGHAETHNNLGNVLRHKKDWNDAIDAYQRAIAANPLLAQPYNNLGSVMHAKGDSERAMDYYKLAIERGPKFAQPHHNIGNILREKGDANGAIASYRKAIELDPAIADAHFYLGNLLADKHDPGGAIDCWNRVLAINPTHAVAHFNIGVAMFNKGDLNAARPRFLRTIELDPQYAPVYDALAQTYLRQGRFAEAGESLRKGLKLLSENHPSRPPLLRQLQQCEHSLTLDRKFPAVLNGQVSPADSREAIALASMCRQPYKKRYAAAARLYAAAFAADPKLAAPNAWHRYYAASSAALAAARQGEDARLLPNKAVSMFRRWALVWLHDELTVFDQFANQNNPAINQAIQQRLARWRRDPDLASIRDPQELDRLADNERAAWQALWRDVDELEKRLAKKDEPTKGHKGLEAPKAKPEGRSVAPSGATGR